MFIILVLLGLVLLVLLGLFLFLCYSGFFHRLNIQTGRYPLSSARFAYKFGTGPYQKTSGIFFQMDKLAPQQKCLGIYYDDPQQVSQNKLRWAAGCIVSEGLSPPDPMVVKSLKSEGYSMHQLPKADKAVLTTFPVVNKYSFMIAVGKVWPALAKYVNEKALSPRPWLEICPIKGDLLYIGPLDHHEDFFVPEAKSTNKKI